MKCFRLNSATIVFDETTKDKAIELKSIIEKNELLFLEVQGKNKIYSFIKDIPNTEYIEDVDSFFRQSVEKIEKIKETNNSPFYGLLIMLSNHTPFDDVDLMEEFDTTISVDTGYSTITRDYLEGTTMNNYLRSVHYADSAIGEFIKELNKKKLLDNTVLIISVDHDATLNYNYLNLLYNYDAI